MWIKWFCSGTKNHHIDNKYNLQTRKINFCYVPIPQTIRKKLCAISKSHPFLAQNSNLIPIWIQNKWKKEIFVTSFFTLVEYYFSTTVRSTKKGKIERVLLFQYVYFWQQMHCISLLMKNSNVCNSIEEGFADRKSVV